jgi:hypothetical protein
VLKIIFGLVREQMTQQETGRTICIMKSFIVCSSQKHNQNYFINDDGMAGYVEHTGEKT